MKENTLKLIVAAVLLLVVGCGVGYYAWGDKPQETAVVVLPTGEEIQVKQENITPATSESSKDSEFVGEGIHYSRKVEHARIASPFGISAGEALSKQEPAKIDAGTTPTINITPDGVKVGKGGDTNFVGGSGDWTWWDTVKQWFKNITTWLIILGIGGVVLFLVVPAIFPAAAPALMAVWTGIKNFFLWLIPIFGGLWTWISSHVFKKAVNQTAVALDAAKTELRAATAPMTGAEAWAIVGRHLSTVQDEDVKKLIVDLGANK